MLPQGAPTLHCLPCSAKLLSNPQVALKTQKLSFNNLLAGAISGHVVQGATQSMKTSTRGYVGPETRAQTWGSGFQNVLFLEDSAQDGNCFTQQSGHLPLSHELLGR